MMQDNKPQGKTAPTVSADFLTRGSDYLARHEGFKLVDRSEELKSASNALMRKNNNNLVVYGPSGVGLSSIVLGLQANKDNPETPFDIVKKRFYWLDTDALFSSGDAGKINEGFQKALATLSRSPDTVLVIEDIKTFIDGARNNGTSNLINALMRDLSAQKFQAIFEARDSDLAELFKCHSEINDIFTFQEIREPEKAALRAILDSAAQPLGAYHGVEISKSALDAVVDLTTKYPGLTLNTAQPKRSEMILEGALTALRQKAHTKPLELETLESQLASLPAMTGKTDAEKAALKIELEENLRATTEKWHAREQDIRKAYAQQRQAEEEIRRLDEAIAKQQEQDEDKRRATEDFRAAAGNADRQKQVSDQYFGKYGEKLYVPDEKPVAASALAMKLSRDTAKVKELKNERDLFESAVAESKAKFDALTKDEQPLVLTEEHVLGEFSRLSRIPMNKLQQDETSKLLNLENTLKARVFGQDEPVEAISKSVRRGRQGLKKPNKPIGSFLFLGPSGVGKTELAKALAAALFGDESALKTYDMSEYQEKHAGATLIGAPPGYEGYAEGGILTNAMRRQPYCVNVFDEIEKAHKDVFDLFLQIIDEGRLTDRRGVPASFGNSINIMTSNIGAQFFLDDSLSFEEAKEKALKDLWDPAVGGFRPEFLNRFSGVFCFNRLGVPQIIMIADKSFKEMNGWLADKGLSVVMDKEDKEAMCKDKYIPRAGGRGILNYIEQTVTSDLAETMLRHPDEKGVVKVTYDRAKKQAVTEFVKEGAPAAGTVPANANKPAAKADFKAAK